MDKLQVVFKFQIGRVANNRLTFLLIVAISIAVLFIGHNDHSLKQAIAYLFVMWLCSFLIDLLTILRPLSNDFAVRNPKRETIYFFMCFILGVLFMIIRFSGVVDWDHLNRFIKLATIPLLLCVFPVALAIIMLLLKYKPKDLGLRLQGLIVIIPVIIISAVTNRLVCPSSLTYESLLSESGGIIGMLYSGFILAGLSEEFFRTIGQTRLGAMIQNKGIAWFIVTVLWASMHIPKWYSDQHDISDALIGAIRIIPIGLMWGYMTHRTKSFLPAVLVHGSNFWGLQNF